MNTVEWNLLDEDGQTKVAWDNFMLSLCRGTAMSREEYDAALRSVGASDSDGTFIKFESEESLGLFLLKWS